jgi:hypothetical protein
MLARMESIKKMTELGVESLKQDLDRKLAEEKSRMSQRESMLVTYQPQLSGHNCRVDAIWTHFRAGPRNYKLHL